MVMKLYLTRNEAAEILGVTPQTISNYVKKGLLVESEVKEPNLKAMCILGSSVERLLKEDYDIVEQSNAIDAMRVELDELWESYKKERDKLEKLHKLQRISYGFHDNIKIISEILAAYLVEMNVLTHKETWLVTEILSERSLIYIVENSDLTRSDISTLYFRALKKLTSGRKPKYNELLDENKKLRELLEIEREKSAALEKQVKALEEGRSSSDDVISIPKQLMYLNPDQIGVRVFNALKVHGVEHLYELALIEKERLFKTRNFGRKCMVDVLNLMDAYGLEFDNIESLRNPKVSFLKGPYVDVPLYVLEQRNRELCHR